MTDDNAVPPDSADDTGDVIDDADATLLTRLLTDLANDPDAPPSTVSGLSVIAAARAAARGGSSGDDGQAAENAASTELEPRPVSSIVPPAGRSIEPATDRAAAGSGGAAAPMASVGELHVLAAQAEAARARKDRRRKGVLALVAAASVAAVAAVVIPLSLPGGSSTTANSARDAGTVAAASRAESEAAGTSAAGGGAAAAAPQTSAGSAAGGASDEADPDANRPPPGPDALTELVPGEVGSAAGAAPPAAPASSCWPALSESAASALSAALPPGAFGAPTLLDLDCGPDPVAGASLPGTAPGTVLVVRVSAAEPGACARGGTEAGVRCVSSGDGVYLSSDNGGQVTAFVYGGGYEVIVGGTPTTAAAVPAVSGLTAEQSIAAAQAVLGAL